MRFLPQARRALAALSFTIIAGAALAQVPIDTASGVLQVVGERFEKRLFVGAEEIPVEGGLMSIEVAERLGDTFLIQTFTGGNACPSFFFWLETAPGDLRRSADFGSCADEYKLDVGHDTLTVTMSAFDNSGGRIAYDYDGRQLVERTLGAKASGLPPTAGGDVWEGRYPFELLSAPEWRSRFVALMGEGALADAQRMIAVSTPMARKGDWIMGRGCQQHACDTTAAAIAVSADGSRLVIALREKKQPPRLWGDPGGRVPGDILKILRNPWRK